MTSCHIRKCNSDNKEEGLNKAYSFPRTWWQYNGCDVKKLTIRKLECCKLLLAYETRLNGFGGSSSWGLVCESSPQRVHMHPHIIWIQLD
jgi:hypothetical protein